jgi:uncharacterized caspase-like protein
MHRLLTFAALCCASLTLLVAPATAEKRVAFVVGNNAYPKLARDKQLVNAINDARTVQQRLQSLGFEVVYGENLDRSSFVEKQFDFVARLGKDDTAFVFFSGHGVSFSGANYLLPSDIPAPRTTGRSEEARLADQAIAETQMIQRITASGARVTIIVIDACRDNPLETGDKKSVGGTQGLAQSPVMRGVLAIYAAGIGQQSLDRLGPEDKHANSIFTRVFIDKLSTPGLELREVAIQTRRAVQELARSIGHEQFLAYYDQFDGEIYLAGRASERPQGPAVEERRKLSEAEARITELERQRAAAEERIKRAEAEAWRLEQEQQRAAADAQRRLAAEARHAQEVRERAAAQERQKLAEAEARIAALEAEERERRKTATAVPPAPTAFGPPTSLIAEMRRPIDNLYAAWRSLDAEKYTAQWAPEAVKYDLKAKTRKTKAELAISRRDLFDRLSGVETTYKPIFRSFQNGIGDFDVSYTLSMRFRSGRTISESACESYKVRQVGSTWVIIENQDYKSC